MGAAAEKPTSENSNATTEPTVANFNDKNKEPEPKIANPEDKIKEFDEFFRRLATISGLEPMTKETIAEMFAEKPQNALEKIVENSADKSQITAETRLANIYATAVEASRKRYLKQGDTEALLANLIATVLKEAGGASEGEEAFDILQELASLEKVSLDETLAGFEFYDKNPYKKKAEKRLARLRKKKV
ncbi:MAG: hypothetical protein LBM01_02285 [Christensenellaceae bacterium]|jgi:hypothetical protein|nr:hypothetical protein [Christensenellaceae bacterium]